MKCSGCDDAVVANQLYMGLNNIMMSINASHNIDEILHIVMEKSCQVLGCDSAKIAMREGNNWVIRYVRQLPDDLIGQTFTDAGLMHAVLAMTTRKPVTIDDAFHDDRTNTGLMKSLGIRSVLVLPLIENNAVTGALLFGYQAKAGSFTDAENYFAGEMITGIAIALENARQYQELEESKKLGDALNEIDTVLFSTKDSDTSINRMLQLATEAIGAETAVIFSKEGDCWTVRHVYNLPDSLLGQTFSNTEVMHTAITVVTKRSLVVQDVSNSPDIDQKFVEMLGIRSLLDFPLIMKGVVIGDLTFHYHSSPVPFNERQVEFVRKLQISISLALENNRLQSVSELAIAARIKAETLTKAKSQFLANMSHELRTPMTGVLGMLDLALAGKLDAEARKSISAAHTSALSMVRILNDILDLTKIEMCRFAIVNKPFSLRKCVEDTVDTLLAAAKNKEISINSTVADGVPDIIEGDQTRLTQVLTNLTGNAVKFTEKGKVEIGVTAGVNAPGAMRKVTFTVTDTGIGIPDDKKNLLFQAFNQIDESDSRAYGGTGLGLVISKEIVELMGGTITFASQEGVGSTFSFTIPLAESGAQSAAEPQSTESASPVSTGNTAGRRLLLVEDDATIREFLGRLLTLEGHQVDLAENGMQAVEMCGKGNYDLVLMDIQMPLLDGFEATRAIRDKEREGAIHTPIVAMTAHASKEDEQRCLAAGMDAFIPKPINFEKALQVIGHHSKRPDRSPTDSDPGSLAQKNQPGLITEQ